jgi:APA family basic amino acid/polyamine antiporter
MPQQSERSPQHDGAGAPRPLLGLRAAMFLIVGIVVGAGIFKAPATVAAMTGSPGWMFLAWGLGGLLSLVGAFCYAELATAYPHAGGDYYFLQRAYGRGLAFLYGWARYAVITTGSIALLAFVFGDYMQQALPLDGLAPAAGAGVYAAAAVLGLALLNLHGLQSGSAAQSWLTLVEIGGLLLVAATAMLLVAPAPPPHVPPAGGGFPAAFGLAMVFVLLTYGGWNEAAYISAELRDGSRNMVRALLLSVSLIALMYLLVCWAYWHTLGMEGLAAAAAPAAAVLGRGFGPAGERTMAVLVAISALTSINATMIVGARTGYAMGKDWRRLGWLAHWDGRRATPVAALLVQTLAALLLVGLGSAGDGFRAMVEFTAPVFWLFFLLTGIALFVLRRRDPQRARPFRVPFYPWLPLIFCASSAAMLYASLSHVSQQALGGVNAAWVGVGVLAAGAVLLLLLLRDAGAAAVFQPERKEKPR